MQNIICVILIGWSCSGDWQPGGLCCLWWNSKWTHWQALYMKQGKMWLNLSLSVIWIWTRLPAGGHQQWEDWLIKSEENGPCRLSQVNGFCHSLFFKVSCNKGLRGDLIMADFWCQTKNQCSQTVTSLTCVHCCFTCRAICLCRLKEQVAGRIKVWSWLNVTQIFHSGCEEYLNKSYKSEMPEMSQNLGVWCMTDVKKYVHCDGVVTA